MTFKIPSNLFGQPVAGALEKLLANPSAETGISPTSNPNSSLIVRANISKADYVQVPQSIALIAKRENHKGINWEQTHYELTDEGLFMPPPHLFMNHFLNVRNAATGKDILYDGNDNVIPREEAQELWNYLSSTERGNMGNCWTWLDAHFKKVPNGEVWMHNSPKVVTDANGSKSLQYGAMIPIGPSLQQNGWAKLSSLTDRGLPTTSDNSGKYVQGKNVYFGAPVADRVAWFVANSYGAYLYCYVNPQSANDSLGVFSCAEGTAQKNGRVYFP